MNLGALSALWLFQDVAVGGSDLHLIMIAVWIIAVCIVLVIVAAAVAGLVVYAKVNKLSKDAQKKAQPLIAKGQLVVGHVNDIIGDLKPKVAAITADLQPKIASVTSDVQHISSIVRSKVDEAGTTFTRVNQTVQDFNATAQDASAKTRDQVNRVNGFVSETLTTTQDLVSDTLSKTHVLVNDTVSKTHVLVNDTVSKTHELVNEAMNTTQQVSRQIQHGIRVPVEKIASWVTAAKTAVENLSDKLPFMAAMMPSGPTKTKAGKRGGRPGPVPVEPVVVVTHIDEE